MSHSIDGQTIFFTSVGSPEEKAVARLLIESLRAFGGEIGQSPFWLFETDSTNVPCKDLEGEKVRVLPLEAPAALRQYFWGERVYVCAQAEEMAAQEVRSLVWLDPTCLIVNPPELYALEAGCEAAVRPVHIQNVGLLAEEPPDVFWKGVYDRVGVEAISMAVDSFVDGKRLRAYFNSHSFSIQPARKVMHRWLELFEAAVNDRDFQAAACQDDLHRIYLFQALFSTLLVSTLGAERIRILPIPYNYPYHLQARIPAERRAKALNDLVCVAHEDQSLDPAGMTDIEVYEPLRGWLAERTTSVGHA